MDQVLVRQALGKKVDFIHGDMACVYGALLAGCNFFAGYPITPATEIAEGMSSYLPRLGGRYIQMEDEIASMGAVIGASWTGAKAMTATSGPGFSLMQENLGYAIMSETPCVLVNVQRSGPSTGQPTMPAQGDMMQARWGTHGDHEIIMLYPYSVQEAMEYTITAFNLAEKFRTLVLVYIDAEIGHMQEKVVVPEVEEVEIVDRVLVTSSKEDYVPFRAGPHTESLIPEFAPFGAGYHTYVTGLTHNEAGLPRTNSPEIHQNLIQRLVDKIQAHRSEMTFYVESYADDCDIAIVSYGITARACEDALEQARARGLKVGMLRLVTIWPFAEEVVRAWAERVRVMVVPEMNLGQMIHPIREVVAGTCEIVSLPKIGGEIHTPGEILAALEKVA
jgi:2-oxoglutarate/2-oxoacid ferredoxin oxidoreductase subunit alpha